MSVERRIPINRETSRPWEPDFNHPFFRDPMWNNMRNSFRDPSFREIQPARDPFWDSTRESDRPYFRELVPRDPIRDTAVYNPLTNALPLSRSFFNPERQLSVMDSEMQRMAQEMRRMFDQMQHLMPVDANPESWRIKENFLLDNPVVHDQSGKEVFRLQFDVRQFMPEEIQVRTMGNQLTVHAKHEEKTEGKSLHREYLRQYVLPQNVSPEKLASKLSRDGVLTLEAPLPITDGGREKAIPIKHE